MCAYTLSAHDSTVWQLDFDDSGKYLTSVGDDRNLMIWSIFKEGGIHKGLIAGLHSKSIYSCSWFKDPENSLDMIATGGGDNKISIYEISRESLCND